MSCPQCGWQNRRGRGGEPVRGEGVGGDRGGDGAGDNGGGSGRIEAGRWSK